jgi:hypothetical protein
MNGDLLSLKLCVDQKDEVWYIHGSGPPVQTKLSVPGFLLQPLCQDMPRYRVAALPQNIHLILAIYLQQLQKERGLIEVCGPMVCNTADERLHPVKTLYAMRQFEQPVSVGGWHLFKQDDYMCYALTSHMRKMKGVIDNHARQLLKNHPAWVPLSFVPDLDMDACARLLALIVDPRWFIDPVHPTRGSRLRSFLGLDLRTMRGVMKEGDKQRYHSRCELVLSAFKSKYDRNLVEQPEQFLWRIHRVAGEKSGKMSVANLRMAQAFIEYLRLCWLAALGRGRHQNEALFVPNYFFNREPETAAFYRHFRKACED